MPDTVTLKSGLTLPSLGFGTWQLGESRAAEEAEHSALLHAIDVGFTHFDTAEMYGDGTTEQLLGNVLRHRSREALVLTSKVYPWNADRDGIQAACDRSLARLGTDYLDLYLLHWPGSVPFERTLEGVERLRAAGKIRAFGVSNFDAAGLSNLIAVGLDEPVEVNQVMYNPSRRGIEFDLLPLMQAHRIACIAYTPIEPRRLAGNAAFEALARKAALTPAQLALAWHLTRGASIPIPKASTIAHADALREAAGIRLDDAQLAAIDTIFPPPAVAQPLDII